MLTKNMDKMRTKGTITSWNDDKGFGFITSEQGSKGIFVHISAFSNRNQRPKINLSVIYSESTDNQGRPRAVSVDYGNTQSSQREMNMTCAFSIAIAIGFLMFLGVSVLKVKIPALVLGLYIVFSIIAFIMYAKDKSAAKSGAWRTSEGALHILALIGGWPGALIAQQTLRHKSKKQDFRMVFWITVILNCGVLIWLFTIEGATALHSLIVQIM